MVHERRGLDTRAPPEKGQNVKQAKVENENCSNHSRAAGDLRMEWKQRVGRTEKQREAQAGFRNCHYPFPCARLGRNCLGVKEPRRVHPRPGQQIAERAVQGSGHAMSFGITIGQPFAARIEGKGHGPHENPRWEQDAHRQGRRWQYQQR